MSTGRSDVFIFRNSSEISGFLLRRWKEIADAAINKKGYFAAALSGGQTPVDFYITLAGCRDAVFWGKTHLFFVDERNVPPDHPDSNYRLLSDILLGPVTLLSPQNLHPVPFEPNDPGRAALQYEQMLKNFFRVRPDEVPAFDFVLLGIGADGHTASLFPGDQAVNETSHLSTFAMLDKQRHNRITLTLPVINQAEHVFMLATGTGKAEIIRKIIEEKDFSFPAARVNPKQGALTFIFDTAAASALRDSSR